MIVYGVNVRFDYETCECLHIVVSFPQTILLIKMGRNFFGGICSLLNQEALKMVFVKSRFWPKLVYFLSSPWLVGNCKYVVNHD